MPQIQFIVDGAAWYVADGNGLLALVPALPQQGRLYVAWSDNHPRRAYVGTSGNVQQRFNHRLAQMNEVGVVGATLQNNFVYWIRILINGVPHQPDDHGIANGIDVEHLLIRIYMNHYQFALRNTQKWNQLFQNVDAGGLSVRHLDPNQHVPGFAALGGGGFHQLLAGAGTY